MAAFIAADNNTILNSYQWMSQYVQCHVQTGKQYVAKQTNSM